MPSASLIAWGDQIQATHKKTKNKNIQSTLALFKYTLLQHILSIIMYTQFVEVIILTVGRIKEELKLWQGLLQILICHS